VIGNEPNGGTRRKEDRVKIRCLGAPPLLIGHVAEGGVGLAGQRGEAGHADYAASKGAIISMVKGLAVELGNRDITVNAVAPGWVDTEMATEAYHSGGREQIISGIPALAVSPHRACARSYLQSCGDAAG
jgi:NAD(P)-dependent dehydrogenase (short-subunit alcohol dehydrogenase family)